MDTAELVKKLRYLKGISKVIPAAADTIERLKREHGRVVKERDAALAEVERLQTEIRQHPLIDGPDADKMLSSEVTWT